MQQRLRSRVFASALAFAGVWFCGASNGTAQNILIFDGSNHLSALSAAQIASPGNVTIATTFDFATLVPTQLWDVVLVNSPGSKPTDWTTLATYISQGGRAVISHWDFDLTTYAGMAALLTACEVSINATITLDTSTITDSGTSAVFAGLPMPNADWHGHWGDDGDNFNLMGSALGLAHLGNPATPTMVLTNGGGTILMPVMDEVGDSWINPGHDVTLWLNCINEVLSGGSGSCTTRTGVLGLNPAGYECTYPPRSGFPWKSTIDTIATEGTSTLGTVLAISLSGTTAGTTFLGYELLAATPFIMDISAGVHSFPVPPGLEGYFFATQGARIEVDALSNVFIVLLNAQDLVIG